MEVEIKSYRVLCLCLSRLELFWWHKKYQKKSHNVLTHWFEFFEFYSLQLYNRSCRKMFPTFILFFFCFLQEPGWWQIYSCPRNSSRDDPGHLSVSHWPVTRGGPTAAAVAGPCGERDRFREGPLGGVGNVGHNVCFLPPKKGGAMLWHRQV